MNFIQIQDSIIIPVDSIAFILKDNSNLAHKIIINYRVPMSRLLPTEFLYNSEEDRDFEYLEIARQLGRT